MEEKKRTIVMFGDSLTDYFPMEKLKDIDAIDAFLNSRNQSATQYFYSCLKRDGVIE